MRDNKLIAEFMGVALEGGGRRLSDESDFPMFRLKTFKEDGLCEWCHNHIEHGHNVACYTLDTEKLKYHKSWDWLMPVVHKIMDMSFQEDGEYEDFYAIRDLIPDIDHIARVNHHH